MLADEKAAILNDAENNVKVIAGPGSGKTRLIIEKVERLLSNGTDPKKILVITYTDKAAEELKHRLSGKMNIEESYVHTFHSFCLRFMRETPEKYIQYKGFRVLDELGQFLFILKWIKDIRNDEIKEKPNKLRNYFGRIKDNYLMHDIEKIKHPLIPCYVRYCDKLKAEKRFDFGDLINCVLEELDADTQLSKLAQNRFDYVFIDEYQDVNKNQERLLKHFTNKKTKIFVVGDRNQSIYGFRGSDVRVFDAFEKNFDRVKTYFLTKNYRSTDKIISFTNRFMDLKGTHCIEGFREKGGDQTEPGGKIKVLEYPDDGTEADEIVKRIKKLKENQAINRYSDVALLFRSVRNDSGRFIKAFKAENIPCKVVGDGELLNLDYVAEIIKCFEMISQGQPVQSSLLKIDQPFSSFEYVVCEGPLALYYKIIEKSEFLKDALRSGEDEIPLNLGKLTWILQTQNEIFGQARDQFALDKFCKYIRGLNDEFLDTEQIEDVENNAVTLLTLHKAKGLEFPVVFLPGANEKNYEIWNDESVRDLFEYYKPEDDLERAFYVGISRAKNLLVLSYYGKPSEYVMRASKSQDIVEYIKWGNESLLPYLESKDDVSRIRPSKKAEKRLELNHYKLIEFWKCGFAYKLRFYYNFQIPRAYILTYGNIVHNLLYYVNMKIKNGEEVDVDQLVEEKTPQYLSSMKKGIKQKLTAYLANFETELRNIDYAEKPFDTIVGSALIRGKIDMLVKANDGGYTIVEFKSGKDTIQKTENAKKQIEIYAYSQKNLKVQRGIIYFVGSEAKIPVKIDKNQMKLDILNTIDEINAKAFTPNTKNCRYCIFNKYRACPYLTNQRPADIDDDTEEDVHSDFVSEI